MARNLVICLDGTGNQVRATGNTNVFKLFGLLDLSDPARQVAFYDPGVGTRGSSRSWTPWGQATTKVLGLAFGFGLRENLGEAYTFLMREYADGDRIFIFGFSRGAYTARALVGMLQRVGLLRPGAENLLPYAVSAFTKHKPFGRDWTTEDWVALGQLGGAMSRKIDGHMGLHVDYVGLWDTVKAAGLARGSLTWPGTRALAYARTIRHAVSIDEQRRPYAAYLVDPALKSPTQDQQRHLTEVWFAGVHSDLGGAFVPDGRLGDIALKWVTEGAVEQGVLVDAAKWDRVQTTVTPDYAEGTLHRNAWLWRVLRRRRRRIPEGANLHDSVRLRMDRVGSYRPVLPVNHTWVDRSWSGP
jgi:uncharacterized protein (DUF2235 family)